MSEAARQREPEEAEAPRIVDKRRIDPQTGELRHPQGSPSERGTADPAADPAGTPAQPDENAQLLAERTADLQRVQAEFANYKRRVERDRVAVAEQALASVLVGLLPVLDDIERARAHGELVGGFQKVAEGLESTLARLGLVTYGEAGEPFDPNVHEALMHSLSDEVSEPTAVEVMAKGYRLGERVLRPARVSVAEPGEPAGVDPAEESDPADVTG